MLVLGSLQLPPGCLLPTYLHFLSWCLRSAYYDWYLRMVRCPRAKPLLHTYCVTHPKLACREENGSLSELLLGTSVVVQWLRIHLPKQGTRVPSLVQEDATGQRAAKPGSHSYWARKLRKPRSATREATMMKNLQTAIQRVALLTRTRQRPRTARKAQRHQNKIRKWTYFVKKISKKQNMLFCNSSIFPKRQTIFSLIELKMYVLYYAPKSYFSIIPSSPLGAFFSKNVHCYVIIIFSFISGWTQKE